MRMFLTTLLLCCLTGVIVWFINVRSMKKIAVVDAVRLFDSYNMKKDLENGAKAKLEADSRQMDSASNKLKMAQAIRNDTAIRTWTNACIFLKQQLQNDYSKTNRDINTQVWKRLNPVINDYGKLKGFHLIIGANGMGTVLYDDSYLDVTDDMIKYVNKRYEQGS